MRQWEGEPAGVLACARVNGPSALRAPTCEAAANIGTGKDACAVAVGDALLNLAGVALGGAIAAFTGSRSSRRGAAADGLTALANMHWIRRMEVQEPEDSDQQILTARTDLLAAGCSWVLVEMHERTTLAARNGAWKLRVLIKQAESQAAKKYGSNLLHPSRSTTRPLIQLGDLFEQALADDIERPLRSRALRPLRVARLKRMTSKVQTDNEVLRMPPREDPRLQEIWDGMVERDVTALLNWPKRRILPSGDEAPIEISDDWYPSGGVAVPKGN